MQQVSLGPLRLADLAPAALLLRETNAGLPADEVERDLRGSFERWPSLQIGAYEGDGLVGLVAGRIDLRDPGLGWSDDIVLEPLHRAMGLGSRLLRAQLQAFTALGCREVRGLSPESLLDKVRFFERHGFRVLSQEIAHGLWGIREGERVLVTQRFLP